MRLLRFILLLPFVWTGASLSAQTLLSEDFTGGSGAFVYSDDVFNNSAQPTYAAGSQLDGALQVNLGGIDSIDIVDGMSGAWIAPFTLAADATVTVSFRYQIQQTYNLEPNECSQALVSIDGAVPTVLLELCGDDPTSSGWQQASFSVPLLAGAHTIEIGGWLNQKTKFNEEATVSVDDVLITQGSGGGGAPDPDPNPDPDPDPDPNPNPDPDPTPDPTPDPDPVCETDCSPPTELLAFGFDTDSQGFSYQDDLFNGTAQPLYASGSYVPGAGLFILLGGVDDIDIRDGMSGGWLRDVILPEDGDYTMSLRYNLDMPGNYEPDECAQVFLSIDGTQYAISPEYCDGTETGWQETSVTVSLTAGVHTLAVGGWNNQKTKNNEKAELYIDDIAIIGQGGSTPVPSSETVCDDGLDGDLDGLTDCADSDCAGLAVCQVPDPDPDPDPDPNPDPDPDPDPTPNCPDCLDTQGGISFDFTSMTPGDFVYEDDSIGATAQPNYASGNEAVDGFLAVNLGGIDGSDITDGMSGAYTYLFSLASAQTVTLTFDYRLQMTAFYEPFECSAVLARFEGMDLTNIEELCGPGDTDWRQAQLIAALPAGTHMLSLGGINRQKTAANESTQVSFDNIQLSVDGSTPPPPPPPDDDPVGDPIDGEMLTANFDSDEEGFVYEDDVFYGSNAPNYASGERSQDGYLIVNLGGIDGSDIFNGMSGGWLRDFDTANAQVVELRYRYRVLLNGNFDEGECAQVLYALDGNPMASQTQLCGGSNVNQDSGWIDVMESVNLPAGTHRLTIGGTLTQKTAANEEAYIYIDDVVIAPSGIVPATESYCNDGFDDDLDGLYDCQDPDCASSNLCEPLQEIYSEEFNNDLQNWSFVTNASSADWTTDNGALVQRNSKVAGFTNSYLVGAYGYYNGGFNYDDYTLETTMLSTAASEDSRDAIGVMFRYQNDSNYYRFLMSHHQGFSRLEKKVNGSWSTLAFNALGFPSGDPVDVSIMVDGSDIMIYLDGQPALAARDGDLSTGTFGLFTQGRVEFESIAAFSNSAVPSVIVAHPVAYTVVSDSTLAPTVEAVAHRVPQGGGVEFVLGEGTALELSGIDWQAPYSLDLCSTVNSNADCTYIPGDWTLRAYLVNSSGQRIESSNVRSRHIAEEVGIGGHYFVAYGDSITSGVGDDNRFNNQAANGKYIGRGYIPHLMDLLANALSEPVIIHNEGLGGTRASTATGSRLQNTLERHPNSKYWLILLGTNDAGSGTKSNNYKGYMRSIIEQLQAAGKVPILAKVPAVRDNDGRNTTARSYNTAIDQLVNEYNLPVVPPDFYDYFIRNQDELYDGLHPDDQGYQGMADEWYDALMDSGILGN